VQGGETLASLARTYHTTPTAIAEANDLDVGSNAGSNAGSHGRSYGASFNEALAPESRLIIPIAPSKQADTSTYAHSITRYHVRKGDTVESVAENFGVSVKMLRGWNHLKGSSLAGRKVLYLHLPITPRPGERAAETHVASKRSGGSGHHARTETASARRPSNGASNGSSNRASIRSSNQSASHSSAGSSKETGSAAVHAAVKHHKVKQGETLYSIANFYNTTVSALKKDNRNLAVLRPGMILVVRNGQ